MPKFIIEIRSKGFTNTKRRIDETTISLKKQALQAKTTRGAIKNLNRAYQGANLAVSRFRNTMLLATFVITPFVLALKKLTEVTKAAELEDLAKGFTSLRVEAGLGANTLNKLIEATDGTVTKMELMRQANNAMLLGVARSTDELAEMFDNAQRLGRVLGLDATESIKSFVTGLGRQSRLMLDNIGIMIKVNQAYEEYADQNNTTVSAMSDQQKKIAFINAGLEQSREKAAALGKEILSTSDKIRTANVQTTEFGETLSVALQPVMTNLSVWLGKAAEGWSQYVRESKPATFAAREVELQAHALRMEIAQLTLAIDDQGDETRELTEEEIKLKEAEDKRIATLKFAIIDSDALLGIEKGMLKVKLGLRDAIGEQEMALLSLLDTQALSLKLADKLEEFEKAKAEIKKRHAEMQAEEDERRMLENLERNKRENDAYTEMQELQFEEAMKFSNAFEQLLGETEFAQMRSIEATLLEIEANAAQLGSKEEVAAVLTMLKEKYDNLSGATKKATDDAIAQKNAEKELEDQAMATAAAVTSIATGFMAMTKHGATAEDKARAMLQTLGQLVMIAAPGGAGALGGSVLQAMAGFIGHTGGLIQNNGIQRFATGGMVQGQDNVPIMAQAGEFIMQRSAVSNIGLQNLAQMNQGGQSAAGLTINIAGDMVGDEDHVRTKVLPAIKEELRREANA